MSRFLYTLGVIAGIAIAATGFVIGRELVVLVGAAVVLIFGGELYELSKDRGESE